MQNINPVLLNLSDHNFYSFLPGQNVAELFQGLIIRIDSIGIVPLQPVDYGFAGAGFEFIDKRFTFQLHDLVVPGGKFEMSVKVWHN